MENLNLIGFWEMKTYRARQMDGVWIDEIVIGGSMVFTEKGKVILFFSSSEGPYGYSGTYTQDKENITVNSQAGIVDDLNGATFHRKIEFLGTDQFKMSGEEIHTGRHFESNFIRAK